MERRKLFIVITLLLFILFLVVYLIFFTALGRKLAGIYKPRLLESEKDVQDTVVCDPMTSIQKCTNLGDPCVQCKDGLYSCQEITGKKQITLENAKGQKYLLPDGTWCLPTAVKQPSPCNTFTSTPIVTKVTDSLYKWRCYCKYPNWVASSGIDGDCDVQIACNHQRNPAENHLVYCSDGESKWDPATYEFVCTDGTEPAVWDSKSQVNLEDTFCRCEPGSYYYENKALGVKECVKNPCGEGNAPFFNQGTGNLDCRCNTKGCKKAGQSCGKDSDCGDNNNCVDGKCACPTGGDSSLPCQISCSQLPDDKKGECSIGCIDDPCRASGGLFDVGSGQCSCCCPHPGPPLKKGGAPTCLDGSIFMTDDNFLAGGYCEDVKDACKRLVQDDKNSCTYYRGGKCTTCPVKTGYGTSINQPFCYDCKYQKGFVPDPTSIDCGGNPKNCGTCAIWFADCDWKSDSDETEAESDNACCTGRCNSQSDTCMPCNDPGLSDDDDYGKRQSKQKDWDDRCRGYFCSDDGDDCNNAKGGANVPIRKWCNSYKVGEDGYSDWSADGLLGFCETSKKGTRYD